MRRLLVWGAGSCTAAVAGVAAHEVFVSRPVRPRTDGYLSFDPQAVEARVEESLETGDVVLMSGAPPRSLLELAEAALARRVGRCELEKAAVVIRSRDEDQVYLLEHADGRGPVLSQFGDRVLRARETQMVVRRLEGVHLSHAHVDGAERAAAALVSGDGMVVAPSPPGAAGSGGRTPAAVRAKIGSGGGEDGEDRNAQLAGSPDPSQAGLLHSVLEAARAQEVSAAGAAWARARRTARLLWLAAVPPDPRPTWRGSVQFLEDSVLPRLRSEVAELSAELAATDDEPGRVLRSRVDPDEAARLARRRVELKSSLRQRTAALQDGERQRAVLRERLGPAAAAPPPRVRLGASAPFPSVAVAVAVLRGMGVIPSEAATGISDAEFLPSHLFGSDPMEFVPPAVLGGRTFLMVDGAVGGRVRTAATEDRDE